MPDAGAPRFGAAAFAEAAAAVDDRLSGLGPGVRRLSAREVAEWRAHDAAAGWEVSASFPDGTRRLLVLIRGCFPFDMPRVVLVDRPPFLTWPHVERDGSLCIGDSMISPSIADPAAVVLERLGAAARLVEELVVGRLGQHLRDEFLTYWLHDADRAGRPILSLLDPRGPTRDVRIWRGERFSLVGENDSSVSAWLNNRLRLDRRRSYPTESALLAWLPKAPMPPYPRSGFDVWGLLEGDQCALSAVDDSVRLRPERCEIVVGVTCDEGPALAAMTLQRPSKLRGRVDTVTRGFRPDRVPQVLAADRYLQGARVTRSVVHRVDAAWVHGRGLDPRQARLEAAKVAVIGCGSVGAPVAIALARAGVGHLRLVDGETFATANVGRHPLGMSSLGLPKASALAAQIGSDCPHVRISAHDGDVETLFGRAAEVFEDYDLVISATAHWSAEAMLDAWQASSPNSPPPIVYGWTEAHACAGQGVAIFANGPRLTAGFDSTGRPLFEITAWPDSRGIRAEPACSGRFQPYGPVELGFVTSMVAELALDVLLDVVEAPTNRVWAARLSRVEAMGGRWSEAWIDRVSTAFDGGVVVDLPWPPASPQTRSRLRAA